MKTILAIILFTATAFAQQKTPPAPGAARPLNLPKITEKKLANGLTVVLAPLPNVPKVTSILTFRSATTASDREGHPGIAQIAASVANEGTDTRTTYKPGHTADEVIKEMDAVIAEVTSKGVTDKELADAKVRYRSNLYDQLESGQGKAHLLSALALFRDDPQQINSLLTPFENVTAAQVKAAAAKYLVATNRTVIDRVPEAKAQPKSGQ